MKPLEDTYLTAQELSDKIRVSVQTIYKWVTDGTIVQGKHYLVAGKKYIFAWNAIFEWLSTNKGDLNERRERRKASSAAGNKNIKGRSEDAGERGTGDGNV
jgi:IS30 family transposase